MAGFFKQFDVVRYTSAGVLTPLASTSLTAYNETTSATPTPGTVSVDANGVVAGGSFSDGSPGDIILFTHGSYAGKYRLKLTATESEAYEENEYRSCTFVVENARTARTPVAVDIYGRDKNNPATGNFYIGTGFVGDTGLEFAYQSTLDQDIELIPVPRLTKGLLTQADLDPDAVEDVVVPGTGGSGGALTGPSSVTDNRFARFDGTTGKLVKQGTIGGADLTLNLKTVYLETYGHNNSGLASAISAISTKRAKLIVTEDVTVSTTQTIPTTCVLSVENNAKITISSSATLTIGKFSPPEENVQCFTGVSSANHILFSAGALPHDTANVGWFGVSGDDVTYPITDICSSLTTNGGGAIFVPVGDWKVNNITLPTNFIRVRGEAMGSDTGGSRFIPKDSGTSYLFRARNSYRNITFEHCALSVGTNTTTWPFLIDVDAGSSGFGCDFHHVTFHASGTSSYPLLGTETDSGAAEFVRASVHNCQFIVPNGSKGIFTDSINGQFTVQDTSFVIGSGDSYGIDFYRCGWVKIDNCDFRGPAGGAYTTPPATAFTSLTCSITSGSPNLTVTSGNLTESMLGQYFFRSGSVAGYLIDITSPTTGVLSANASASITSQTVTITKWATSTTRGGTCIKVGDISAATIVECQDEGFNYFLRVSGVGVDRPVVLLGNRIQDQIYLQDSASPIFMFGNFLYSNAWQDGSGVESQIHAFNTVLPQLCQNSAVSLTKSNNWGAEHAGSSVFRTDFSLKTGLFQQDFNYFTRIVEKSGGALTRPLLDILTTYDTSGSSQMLLRIGVAQATASGNPFKYGWTAERDTDTGYLKWKGTQDDPYNGWSTDFPIGYDSTVRGTVTQTTSRTTAVTCNYLHGIITCYSTGALPAGGSAIFQVNNTWVQNGDFVQAEIVSGADSELTQAWVSRVGGNLFKITIFNHSLTASETGTLKVAFTVVQKNGGVGGISY